MRTTRLFLVLIAFVSSSYSQNLPKNNNFLLDFSTNQRIDPLSKNEASQPGNLLSENLVYDCHTVFWTVNGSGNIQQWNLIDGEISGGEIVQTNSGISLAFCGAIGSSTFYSSNYPSTGILKLDDTLGWINIPTSTTLINNGGYLEDQYFCHVNGNLLQDLYHFDGVNLNLIEQLTGSTQFRIADIAVDSLGRAWLFTGVDITPVETLSIYDKNGLVASYPFPFNGVNCYGSFFIDDVFYVGIGDAASATYPNSIVPITINGSTVTTGTPIPFPYDGYFDMASCNNQTNLSTQTYQAHNGLKIYPNPTTDMVNIDSPAKVQSVMIYSMENKLLKTFDSAKRIDLSDLGKSVYILKVICERDTYYSLIVKK